MNLLKKLLRIRDYDALQNQLRVVEQSNKIEREALIRLTQQNEHLRNRLRLIQPDRLGDLAASPPTPEQILAPFALVDDATPWWRALHWLLQLQKEEETSALCLPNCDSDVRHYRAGRLAQLSDLAAALHQKRAEAQKEE